MYFTKSDVTTESSPQISLAYGAKCCDSWALHCNISRWTKVKYGKDKKSDLFKFARISPDTNHSDRLRSSLMNILNQNTLQVIHWNVIIWQKSSFRVLGYYHWFINQTRFTNHLSLGNYSVQSEMTVKESNAAETLSKHVCSYSLYFSVKDMAVWQYSVYHP